MKIITANLLFLKELQMSYSFKKIIIKISILKMMKIEGKIIDLKNCSLDWKFYETINKSKNGSRWRLMNTQYDQSWINETLSIFAVFCNNSK